MTVEMIAANYLREHGYDGLYNSGECCCKIDDLFPRCTDGRDCEPGVKVPCDPETCSADGDCEYHIGERCGVADNTQESLELRARLLGLRVAALESAMRNRDARLAVWEKYRQTYRSQDPFFYQDAYVELRQLLRQEFEGGEEEK